ARSLIESWAVGPEMVLAWADGLPVAVANLISADVEAILVAVTELQRARPREECLYLHLKNLLASRELKVVIFCCTTVSADALHAFLRSRMSSVVERHGRQGSRGDEGWTRFLNSKSCNVLICDKNAEEGL